MGVKTAGDVVRAARELAATVDAEAKQLQELLAENAKRREEAARQAEEEGRALSRALLPELIPAALAEAKRLAGDAFRGRNDPIRAMEEDRAQSGEELRGIEADPDYIDRDLLLADLRDQRREAEDLSAPDRDILARAKHERLERLLTSGYDTPAYPGRFWHLDYYRDWKAGDEVVEKFPGKATFREVRESILEARKTVEVFDAKLADLKGRIDRIEALAARRGELANRLENLATIHLDLARERLREYLLSGDQAAIGERLGADPGLAESFKLTRGLAAKVLYLERIGEELARQISALAESRAKLERDAQKWDRAKRRSQTVSQADFERRYLAPREKMRRRRERYGRMSVTVYEYRDYGRADLAGDLLWWDYFTDGRLDGDFIPEVSSWRRSHPDYRYGGIDHDAQAAAYGAGTTLDGGARMFSDPS